MYKIFILDVALLNTFLVAADTDYINAKDLSNYQQQPNTRRCKYGKNEINKVRKDEPVNRNLCKRR